MNAALFREHMVQLERTAGENKEQRPPRVMKTVTGSAFRMLLQMKYWARMAVR